MSQSRALSAVSRWLIDRALLAPAELRQQWVTRSDMYSAIRTLSDLPVPPVSQPEVLNHLNEDLVCEGSNDFLFIGIRGEIGAYGWPVDNYEKRIAKAKTIQLGIGSNGGSVDHALKMIAALSAAAERGATIEGLVHDHCYSAACLILQGCTVRKMPANATLMWHRPNLFVAGDASLLRRQADWLEKVEQPLIEIFQKRTGLSREKIAAWHDGAEHYFTAEQALELNLVDFVTESIGSGVPAGQTAGASAA